MKGVLFSIVEETVSTKFGANTWDRVLTSAGVDGGYTSLGNYPDAEFQALIEAGSRELGVPQRALTVQLGQLALGDLARRYPAFFTPHQRAIDFVLTINDVIHPEVRKMLRESSPPNFAFETTDDGDVLVTYDSARRLCALAEGMMRGAATHYGDELDVTHDSCMDSGDAACVLRCRFSSPVQSG